MNTFTEKKVIWDENHPDFNIAVMHPEGSNMLVKYDPDAEYQPAGRKRLTNACGNYPYVGICGSRPDMRHWQFYTVYPMESKQEQSNLNHSISRKKEIQTSFGKVIVKGYDTQKDLFKVVSCITNETLEIEKRNIDFFS